MRQFLTTTALGTVILVSWLQVAYAQDDVKQRLDQLTRRVDQMGSRPRTETVIGERGSDGAVLFLYGVFCALWAQNTNRNPWLWFFVGLFFSVITVLVLLSKNADDRNRLHRDQGAS